MFTLQESLEGRPSARPIPGGARQQGPTGPPTWRCRKPQWPVGCGLEGWYGGQRPLWEGRDRIEEG